METEEKSAKKSNKRHSSASSSGTGNEKSNKKQKIKDKVEKDSALGKEEDLPRGGTKISSQVKTASRLTNTSKLELDNLFGNKPKTTKPNKASKKRKEQKKKSTTADEKTEQENSSEEELEELLPFKSEAPTRAKILTMKGISVGMSILGCVKEITDVDIIVNLPNTLKGYISIAEVSDAIAKLIEETNEEELDEKIPDLSKLVRIGQFVRCVVQSIEDYKDGHKIQLSLRSTLVNAGLSIEKLSKGRVVSAHVKSIEDIGYLLSLGLPDCSAFLSNANAQSYIQLKRQALADPSASLEIGEPLECLIETVNVGAKTVTVEVDAKKVSEAITKEEQVLTIDTLKAGMLVNTQVRKILPNGLFVSFLDYFKGTIEYSHLNKGWDVDIEQSFKINNKMKARIMFVDYQNKQVGLSLKSHIVRYSTFSFHPLQLGQIIEDAIVKRNQNGIGSMLDLPVPSDESSDSHPTIQAFAHVSQLSKKHSQQLEKKYGIGTSQRCRIISFDYLDGIAIVSLKKSIINAPFLTVNDLVVGSLVEAVVSIVKGNSIIANISEHIKGLCPSIHLADVRIKDPAAKFKVGQKLKFRVLDVNPQIKRVTLTHKRTLLESELPIITKFEDATEKVITHGYISKVLSNGVIVSFYGGVYGLVNSQELSVDPVICKNPQNHFKVGQAVKCRIISCDPENKKMKISLRISDKSSSSETSTPSSSIPVGSIVKGTIKSITKSPIEGNNDSVIWIEMKGDQRGLLTVPHLSDHLSLADKLKEIYANSIGKEIEEVLILHHDKKYGNIVSLKPSLIQAAKSKSIPSSFSDLQKGTVIHGYVKSVQPYGVFVGFLDTLTGLAPKSNLSDSFISQPSDSFTVGQSIRAYISEIDTAENKFVVNLKHSLCFSTDASLMASYFKEVNEIASFAVKKSKSQIKVDWNKYEIGSVIQVQISEVREFGAISKIEGETHVTGFTVSHHTKGIICTQGIKVTARILDIDKEKRIIDLSFRPELTSTNSSSLFRKIHKLISIGSSLNSTIELIKENYLIVSLNGSDAKSLFIGYSPTRDFNESINPFTQYKLGLKCESTVHYIPDSLSNRILCSTSRSVASQGKRGVTLDKSAQAFDTGIVSADELSQGTKVQAKILAIHDHFIHVALGLHITGRIHITEAVDFNLSDTKSNSFTHPFDKFKVGDIVDAKVLSIAQSSNSDKYLPLTHQTPATKNIIELTVRPSVMLLPEGDIGPERLNFNNISNKKGEIVDGIIHQVTVDGLWVYISNSVRGRVFVLDASDSIDDLTFIQERFRPGQRVKCRIIAFDSEKNSLDLSIKDANKQIKKKYKHANFQAGQIVVGRVAKIVAGKGMNIQLSGHIYGRVHITDVSDEYSSQALSQYEELQFVKCYVLEVNKGESKDQIFLSLRNSRVNPQLVQELPNTQKEITGIQDLHIGDVVTGYVDCVVEKVGCFIWFSRSLKARAAFSELSDIFIDKPAEIFTPGKVVTCKILSLDAGTDSPKIDVSIKESVVKGTSKHIFYDDIKVGMTLTGQIKRIERFGVFIRINNSKLSALCHSSELDNPQDLSSAFKIGDPVKAKVISLNSTKKQFSLSLKKEHFTNEDQEILPDIVDSMEAEIKELKSEESLVEKPKKKKKQSRDESTLESISTMEVDTPTTGTNGTSEGFNISAGFEWEEDDKEKVAQELQISEDEEEGDELAKKRSKKAKKAEKERREREIMEKERKAVEGETAPQSTNDFEKLLLSSPSNSFLWIKYMAYHISLNEIEKARVIAERAIKTINIREEAEKQNIWVAWLNLENSYGSQDSLNKVFNNALSYNDPKWTYIKLLEIYEKSRKNEEAEQLLKVMTKKFKESAKVWRKYAMLLLNTDRVEEFRNLVPQALKVLPKRKHIPIISKFAQFEFKHGSAERGRTIFQGIVSNYPKRADIWNIYIDMELNHGDMETIRNLFEKVTSLNLSSKKMKFFFKRYLEFEKKSGDEQTVQSVIHKAQQYINAKTQ